MLDDLRTAFRRLRNAPVFTVSAVVIIALAIGCNAAILGIADAVLFRPLPYADPGRVFVISRANPKTGQRAPSGSVPYEYVQVIQEHHRGITGVGLRGMQGMETHVGATRAEWLSWVAVSPSYLKLLGIVPVRGRLFDERDAAEPGRAVMLSYECWQRLFAGDDKVIGAASNIAGTKREVIGVLPRGFVFPSVFLTAPRFGVSGRPDFVTTALPPAPGSARRFTPVVPPFGPIDPIVRLKPGVTREQAQAELDRLVRGVKPAMVPPSVAGFVPVLDEVRTVIFPTGRSIMAWLLVAAALVVLAGCANLAVMLLARARLRQAEFGVLLALGASRWRIVRPMLIETLLIGLAGGALGLAAAYSTFGVLLAQVPPVAYAGAPVGIDFRVGMVALALGLTSGLVFGAAPAWRAASVDVQDLLRGQTASRRSDRLLARPLVAAQVSVAIPLVFGAVVAGRAFVDVLRLPLGFNPSHVATLRIDPPERAAIVPFYRQALEMLGRRPDVLSAGAGGHVPLDGYAPDAPDEDRRVGIHFVLPGYLETIGATLLRGRLLRWEDATEGSGTCVVTRAAARALFPAADPLGQTVRIQKGRRVAIVGIVGDIRQSVDGKDRPGVFALAQDERRGFVLVARTRGQNAGTLSDLRREVGGLSPREPLVAQWWTDSIDALVPFRNPRFQLIVLGTFAALALVFTGLGIFAIVSLVVAARMREIGVRLALGARPRSVAAFAARHALLPVAAGCVMGLVMTRWLASFVRAQLYAVNTEDPVTLAAAVLAVVLAAVAAAYIPARAASRVDPVDVLRTS